MKVFRLVLISLVSVFCFSIMNPSVADGLITKDHQKKLKKDFKKAKTKLGATAKLKLYLPPVPPSSKHKLLSPSDLEFKACAPLDETDERELKLISRKKSVTTIESIKLQSSLEADWTLDEQIEGTDVNKSAPAEFTITFNPAEPRLSEAQLLITAKYKSGSRATVTIPLVGDGTPCPAATATESGFLDLATNPKIAIGAGKALALPKKVIEVCIAAHLVKPEDWDKMNKEQQKQVRETREKQVNAAIAEANAIWAANHSGIQFKRKKPITLVDKVGDSMDVHCLDLYFDAAKTEGSGDTRTSSLAANKVPDLPAWIKGTKYGKKLRTGDRISVSLAGKAGANGRTLAHELGHALGLGVGDTPKDHREVDDWDKEIKDATGADKRLMKHENPGKEMRKREVELAQVLAKYMNRNAPTCEKGVKSESGQGYVPPNEQGDLKYAYVISRPDTVEFQAEFTYPITFKQPIELAVQLDLNNDGLVNAGVSFKYSDGEWLNQSTHPIGKTASVQHLGIASAERTNPLIPLARGVSIQVPRTGLTEFSDIGWQVSVQLPALKSKETIPVNSMAAFDITRPWIEIGLSPDNVEVTALASSHLNLRGPIKVASTFSGTIALSLDLISADVTWNIDAGTLIQPLGDSWSLYTKLPPGLKTGIYKFRVNAKCDICRAEDSAEGFVYLK